VVLFLNLLGDIQDKHNGPYPGNNIFGSMFDTGRPTEYEVGTHGSVPIDKKYDASCYE